MPVWTITIPLYRPPMANQWVGRHWAVKHRLRREMVDLIALYARQQGVPLASGPRTVALLITLAGQQRACDPDAYHKLALDALVCAGQLVDDSASWVRWAGVVHHRGEARQTLITLTEDDRD